MENKAVIIKVNGTKNTVDWNNQNIGNIIHETVEGDFEHVPLQEHGWIMCVNEEGLMRGLDPNNFATTLYLEEFRTFFPILGNVIILGVPNNEGHYTGLKPEQISTIYDHPTEVTVIVSDVSEDAERTAEEQLLQDIFGIQEGDDNAN